LAQRRIAMQWSKGDVTTPPKKTVFSNRPMPFRWSIVQHSKADSFFTEKQRGWNMKGMTLVVLEQQDTHIRVNSTDNMRDMRLKIQMGQNLCFYHVHPLDAWFHQLEFVP